MKNRREARELALQVLYACEMGGGEDVDAALESIAETNASSDSAKIYARELVRATRENMVSADQLIAAHAANWEIKRMAAIDRNLLRMAIAELRYLASAPPKVVIDEAVEIAKIYGTEESSRFVNGVIDSIYKNMQKSNA